LRRRRYQRPRRARPRDRRQHAGVGRGVAVSTGAAAAGGTDAPPRAVPRVRSALFIPGSRSDFLEKADQRGADAVLLDLEDAVTEGRIDAARTLVRAWLEARPAAVDPVACVRLHALDDDQLE